MNASPLFDPELIRRYDLAGPRYTSYPTAPQFHEGFGEADYRRHAAASNPQSRPLSLYFHLPFCATVCYYCGCNKVVTRDQDRAAPYVDLLAREIEMQAALLAPDRPVTQLHWGGGTPTFLRPGDMRRLMAETARHFSLAGDDKGEYSIEIDPRCADAETLELLRELGFNRLSLGVQDFDPRVQRAVNRLQGEEETRAVIEAARRLGFSSISIDLIYGLPFQTAASFAHTLDRVLALDPDRLSVYNYAHLPHMFKPQRRINRADLPSPAEKLDILRLIIENLGRAGYDFIGMDHFAKPNDELARAQRHGTLHRNFQGYSTHGSCDLVAMGVTSISKIGGCYAQNMRGLKDYETRIRTGRLAVFRGIACNRDDTIRGAVITELMCHFRLDFAALGARFGIDFEDYFKAELTALEAMSEDGLLGISDGALTVTTAGRLLVRNICMVFDRYLAQAQPQQRFSKVI